MELQEINPEFKAPRQRNLGESQNLLSESNLNLQYSKDNEDVDSYIITKTKRKKGTGNFIRDFLDLFFKEFDKAKIKNKILIIIALIISTFTLVIKIYIFFVMLYYLIKRIKILNSFILERILDNSSNKYFLSIINYIFLLFGFIILFIEMFCQFIIRNRTLLTINECSLKSLILSKCLYFISLGFVPEVIFATVPFKSKKNVFLSFFYIKLSTQPYILIILIIYILYTLFRRNEETKIERIKNEIKLIKKIINEFVDKYIFVWNNFNEKTIIEKEKEKKEKEDDDKININNISASQKLSDSNNIINNQKRKSFPIIRRKRKGSKDENENKTKYQKLLGKIDEEDEEKEDGQEKKVIGFIKKINQFKKRISLFWTDNIFARIKKYAILLIIAFFLCSAIINGVFGYGYYVFYESDVHHLFQLELILCFIFGFILILLTD